MALGIIIIIVVFTIIMLMSKFFFDDDFGNNKENISLYELLIMNHREKILKKCGYKREPFGFVPGSIYGWCYRKGQCVITAIEISHLSWKKFNKKIIKD